MGFFKVKAIQQAGAKPGRKLEISSVPVKKMTAVTHKTQTVASKASAADDDVYRGGAEDSLDHEFEKF